MIQGHEEGVDHNAQGDEEVDERIEDDERQVLKRKGNIKVTNKWPLNIMFFLRNLPIN